MSRHILDRPRVPSTGRAPQYLEIERQAGPHRSTQVLQKRARDEKPMGAALRDAQRAKTATGSR